MNRRKFLTLAFSLLAVCSLVSCAKKNQDAPTSTTASVPSDAKFEQAIFAGGCFWCMQSIFEQLPGVIQAQPGYTGGQLANPSYEQVSSGTTGHREAVLVRYDPNKVTYPQLVEYFWRRIDPTVDDRQFCNVGAQYRTAIYYLNDSQRQIAVASKAALEQSGLLAHVSYPVKVDSTSYPAEFQNQAQINAETQARREAASRPKGHIYTEILAAHPFYPAEAAHQDYARKHPIRFDIYRLQCGRDARLKHVWRE